MNSGPGFPGPLLRARANPWRAFKFFPLGVRTSLACGRHHLSGPWPISHNWARKASVSLLSQPADGRLGVISEPPVALAS